MSDIPNEPSMGLENAAPPEPPPEPPLEDAPSFDDLPNKPDDDQIALVLAPLLRGALVYFFSAYRGYEHGYWRSRDVYELRRFMREKMRPLRKKEVKITQARIRSITAMLEDELFIADATIRERQREQAKYINLRNGLFNLNTFELEPHRADLYFTSQMDFNYDPDAYSSAFRRYLNSSLVVPGTATTDWDLVERTIEALAYCMTARTDLKASFWLVGGKDTGKSTMIALIKGLMGDLHTTIDLTQLGVNRFLLSGIVGKRVITFSEGDTNAMLPDALYKALTGGSDELYADVKNKDPIVFRPECKPVWAMNNMPRMADRTGATARRIVMIPFNRTIPDDERIGNLEQLLLSERSGIFNTLMDGLQALNRRGWFAPCQQSEQMLQDYIMENDTEATFIQQRCETHESYKVQSAVLYKAYSDWCAVNGFKPKNSNQIAKEWTRLGFMKGRSNGSLWHGVRISADFSV